jgi:hypothetical protein
VLFSLLGSLTFFRVINIGRELNLGAFVSLALSMGVVSIAVIWSLTKLPYETKKDVWISSLYYEILYGLIVALLQTLAAVFFRGKMMFGNASSMVDIAKGSARVCDRTIQRCAKELALHSSELAHGCVFKKRL